MARSRMVIVAVCVQMAVAYAVGGCGPSPGGSTQQLSSPAAPAAAAAPEPAREREWVEVASWSGKSIRSTEKFTVGSPWKIVWDTRPGDLGAMNFQIFVYGEDGMVGVAANVIGGDQDESIEHKAGTYHFQFNTAQPYTVRVLELR